MGFVSEISSPEMKSIAGNDIRRVRVYSDWTRRRQFVGVKHDALVLEHVLVNRSIHMGRGAL